MGMDIMELKEILAKLEAAITDMKGELEALTLDREDAATNEDSTAKRELAIELIHRDLIEYELRRKGILKEIAEAEAGR